MPFAVFTLVEAVDTCKVTLVSLLPLVLRGFLGTTKVFSSLPTTVFGGGGGSI